jgi:uncharacterized protein (DUF2147 family)
MIAAAVVSSLVAGQATGGDLSGLWRTPVDGGSVIRLAPCGAELCGRIVTSPHIRAVPDQRDIRNRDPAQRDRVLRDLMVMKVRPLEPGKWGQGWIYNPEDGGTYRGEMILRPDGALRLTGCIVPPFCKTQTWRRVQVD